MDTILKDPENPIAWHLRLAKATNDEWDSGDIPTIRKVVQEKVDEWICKAPPALREIVTVVLPFSKDYSEVEKVLEEVGYTFTGGKFAPKKSRGCVLLRNVPETPNKKSGTIYQLPCPVDTLANWQEQKLARVEPGVKIVPSISELVPMIQSDLIAKRPKTSGPNPMEELLRARISELASVIRKKAETRKN